MTHTTSSMCRAYFMFLFFLANNSEKDMYGPRDPSRHWQTSRGGLLFTAWGRN